MAAKERAETLEVAGRTVTISNPGKVYFPTAGHTKLDVVRYYLAVGEAALRGIRGRPIVLKRYVDGAEEPAFYQKRAPTSRPDWIETTTLRFPSGRSAEEIVVNDLAQLAWIVNLGCIDLHPHPVRAIDLEHPDELRVDLDPVPGVPWDAVRRTALLCRDVLAEHGLVAWPKTSGSRGMHLWVRIEPRWTFADVRRAALALAREVERRAPELATSAWWKEERQGVFIDYNQNAKDRTTASAYSIRPTPDARVSTPLAWGEVGDCDPAAFTLVTVPGRLERVGDPAEGIDAAAGTLDSLLALSDRQAEQGLGDAPWPPHYAKGADEPTRVAPSRRAGARAAKPTAKKKAPTASPRGAKRTRDSATLVTIARAKRREDALAGLERWKTRHPDVAARLADSDVLVDTMRGRSSTWTRIRINLRGVPAAARPPAEPPDPDYDPRSEWA
jgi:bifunctional non-homologous end joining protein LigD